MKSCRLHAPRTIRWWTRASQVIASLAMLAGCALVEPRPGVPPATPDASAALEVVARRDDDTRTMTASFRLATRMADGREEGARGALALARPERLRLQLFSLGLITVFDYTVNGDRYRLRQQGHSGIRYGQVGDDEVLQPAQWLGRLFLGAATGRSTVESVEGGFRVKRLEREGWRELWIPRSAAVITEETLRRGEQVLLKAHYGGFQSVEGIWLPRTIDAELPSEGVTISIEVDEYERNVELGDEVFELPAP